MFWHWQNLKDDRRNLLHGRAWLHFGRERDRCVGVEWRVGRWHGPRLLFEYGGMEEDYGLSVGVGFAELWITLSGFRAYDALPRNCFPRTTGVYLHGDHLVAQWACDDSEWSSETGPKHGRYWSCFVLDVLFGRAKHAKREEPPVVTRVRMPEGEYTATVTMHDDTWTRPRWPWPKRIRRGTVELPVGVPVPAKGENAWDCGEDAVYGLTAPARTVSEAVENVRRSALETRERRGGPGWRPKDAKGEPEREERAT